MFSGRAVYVFRPLHLSELAAPLFGTGHFPGSLNISLESALFPTWVGFLVPARQPVAFVADRQDSIDALNRRHGLGSGHNRGRSRTRPADFPELVKTFRESVLNLAGVDQPF